jgi:hypothetical protein
MSAYPALNEYNGAVQNPRLAFSDPALKMGAVETTGLGLPRALGGGFAITYTVSAAGRKYAVRCFHKPVPKLEETYSKISSALASDKSGFFVGFQYQASGVLVNGKRYPIVRMDWADGKTLGAWLEDNSGNRASLQQLRQQFTAIASYLRGKSYAHGDLQNGNVIINSHACLIDYDGIYVPGLPIGQGTELGHKHFQHPKRSPANFGPEMDRFAFIVIDFSLNALIQQPSLFVKYSNGENIIFTASDFAAPSQSSVFQELFADAALRTHAQHFAQICAAPIERVPILNDFLAGRNIPSQPILIPEPGKRPSPGPPPYIGAFDVIDALDFVGFQRRVGDRVELVGRIQEVRPGRTKYGKPYVFLNFGDWRSAQIKINIWSEGLAKLPQAPGKSWTGRWISVTGLVDQPYKNKKHGYTHLSITVTDPNQLRTIEETEACRRLASIRGVKQTTSRSGTGNQAILKGIRSGSGTPPGVHTGSSMSGSPGTSAGSNTRNQSILAGLGVHAPPKGIIQPSRIQASSTPSHAAGSLDFRRIALGIAIILGISVVISIIRNSQTSTPPSKPNTRIEIPINTPPPPSRVEVPNPAGTNSISGQRTQQPKSTFPPLVLPPEMPGPPTVRGNWPMPPEVPQPGTSGGDWSPKNSGPETPPDPRQPNVSNPPPLDPAIEIGRAPNTPDDAGPANQPLNLDSRRSSPEASPQGGPFLPAPAPTRNLSSRSDVYWIQTRLRQLGFLRIQPTGTWDAISRGALRDFKVVNQLPQDDVWDVLAEQKLDSGSSLKAGSTFVGSWSESPRCVRDELLVINTRAARTAAGVCDFLTIRLEAPGWRIRAKCMAGSETWIANIKLILRGRQLTWSSEREPTTYYRCQ